MPETIDLQLYMERRAASAHSIITSFTPSIMGEAMLRDIFVARQPLVDRLVRNIRDATKSEARRHALLVGPRGIGKTHLVSMVYYAIRDDAALSANLRIAWLREEEWSVFSWADLLVQIFRALANEYAEERQHLTQIADQLRRLPIDEGAALGEAQLLEFLGDRVLLIIAENVNDIFEGMGEQGQQSLRAFLQNHSRALLLTTAPALSADLSEHDAPFYGFFNTTHLQELTRAEARELLINIAGLDGPNSELVAYLNTDEADRRLRVIETLAGGHPRIWILFSACMSQKLLDELVPLFIKMLDDLTPYYQERMRSLPPQERRLISYLCERRGAVPVKEIADACRLKPNAAAALLGKLEEKAFVRKAAEPTAPSTGDRRVTFYEMREPLMRLCIEVKTSRAQPLGLIVEFLRLWFQEYEIAARLVALPPDSQLTAQYLSATLTRIGELRDGLSDILDEATINFAARRYRKTLLLIDKGLSIDPNNYLMWMFRALTLAKLHQPANALASLDRSEGLLDDIGFVWTFRGGTQNELGLYDEAIMSFRRALRLEPNNESSHFGLFHALLNLGKIEEALIPLKFFLRHGILAENLDRYLATRIVDALLTKPFQRRDFNEIASALVRNFARRDLVPSIASVLVESIPFIYYEMPPPMFVTDWLAAWEQAALGHSEMDIALRILSAAVEWKRTRDRGAILRLAAEERVVLESLLPKEESFAWEG